MQVISTIALATRLKRRVFSAKAIAESCDKILAVIIGDLHGELISEEWLPYGVVLEVRHDEDISAEQIASRLRNATSSPIRREYMELWSMPSLWTKKCFLSDKTKAECREDIERFFGGLKTR